MSPIFTAESRPSSGPAVRVAGSVVVELEWVLCSSQRQDFRRDHPVLGAVYDADPDLADRVGSFWSGPEAISCAGYTELVPIAHHGGVLFSLQPEELLGRLEDLCASLPDDTRNLALTSETDEDRAAIRRRLARLRRSASLRHDYAELLRAVWAAVGDAWERDGRPSVDTAVAQRRSELARGADWREIARSGCDYGELLPKAVGALGPSGTVAVVPAFFAHLGLMVDLPDLVLVGIRSDVSSAAARARTGALAKRLKALSEPTRLAILDSLRTRPRSVSELASSFGLAQPTVSNHVKLLREAGLVDATRDGARRQLAVVEPAVSELLSELQLVLTAEPPS